MSYRMTPARRAALKKAQKASARKRRGKGKGKLAAANRRATRNRNLAMATGGLALVGAGGMAYASRGQMKKAISNNPTVRKHVAKKMMKEARARRAKRG